MVIVQKLGELFAQTFVALVMMSEHDRALKQRMLELLRKIAPNVGGRCAENQKEAGGVFIGGALLLRHRFDPGWLA